VVNASGIKALEPDLQLYLRRKTVLFSPKMNEVVADAARFCSACLRDGFRVTLTKLGTDVKVRANRPFIEVYPAIVDHHLRLVDTGDHELIGKSLSEAYIYFADPQHVFQPVGKTRFMQSLRRHGAGGFARLFLSLHLYNVVSVEIQDDVAARISDLNSFQMYMLVVEAICADIVKRVMKGSDGKLDERWAASICAGIEAQLLLKSMRAPH
jgi:hypothetical protein